MDFKYVTSASCMLQVLDLIFYMFLKLNKSSLAYKDKKVEVEDVLKVKKHAVVSFDAASCSVMENCGTVKLTVVRSENLKQPVTLK